MAPAATTAAVLTWHTDIAVAKAAAAARGTKLMLLFTGSDWCPPCKAQKAEIFDQPDFAAWAASRIEAVYLDFPTPAKALPAAQAAHNRALATSYEVQSYPTVIFATADGTRIGQLRGHGRGTALLTWTRQAEGILAAPAP